VKRVLLQTTPVKRMKYLEDDKLTKLTSELTEAMLGRARSVHGKIEAYTMKRAGTDKKYAHALGERYVAEMETVESQLADYKTFMQRHPRLEQMAVPPRGRKRSMSAGTQLEAAPRPTKQQRPRANSFDSGNLSAPGPVPNSSHKSPLGDFCEMGTRRLMTDLILTLNASFPDYDFGSIRPSDFEKVAVSSAMQRVNERLSELAVEKASFLSDMWTSMDDVVRLADCDVYSYSPKARNEDDDPLSFLTQTLIDQVDGEATDSSSLSSSTNTVLWSFNYFFVNKTLKRIVFFTCIERMRNNEEFNLQDDDVSYVRYHGTEASDVDFDLDPSADVAGGIPVSII
jgi:hypothetical protein